MARSVRQTQCEVAQSQTCGSGKRTWDSVSDDTVVEDGFSLGAYGITVDVPNSTFAIERREMHREKDGNVDRRRYR